MNFIVSMLFIFHEIIGGNFDLFYLLSAILIILSFFKKQRILMKSFKYFYLILFYGLVQILLSDDIVIYRLLINIIKIYLNIFLFIYIKEKLQIGTLSIKKIIYLISFTYLFLFLFSLVVKSPLLWRLNDLVNPYAPVRLRLFYFEPSELSFHSSLVVIFLVFYFIQSSLLKEKIINIILLLTNVLIILFSSALGGIVSLLLSLLLIALIIKKNSYKRLLLTLLFLTLSITTVILTIKSNNNLVLRINDIFNGSDGSFNYRFTVSFNVMKQMLLDTNFLGVGFGNLNTDVISSKYISFGLVDIIANSYMYFIAESGIFGIIFILIFNAKLMLKVEKNYKLIAYPLLIFIIFYQIAGGYFTNPINWLVYGVITNSGILLRNQVRDNIKIIRNVIN
ncbi:O-antigen ligase family protein [Paenibacillus sp. BSR1-1]|uniref:O-antigen ligase family protein n=1 Tax=Paenibacillus sp. BSR1-1 TaxID=3020845 RepID=UPI0025B0E498|nr:O-antigen ligase family protein [Paenibacillus sp. BSR1-1]MDN3019182.1 O-antigen ligase family protein [Paenibacillus sp. BSR1-1]